VLTASFNGGAESGELALARFAADLGMDRIGTGAIDAFDRLVLDFVSVVIAGLGDSACARAADAFGGLSHPRSSAPALAFALGTCAHWLDWDDTDDDSHVHGGAVIFPALLAMWSSGLLSPKLREPREFVAAVVAAYDIACRIGGHLRSHGHRGWMPTGSGGALGAAAAGARLAGGGSREILSAMGMTAVNAGISRQALADQTNSKGVLAGIAAKCAVESVMLTRRGIDGPPRFLDGPYGLSALQAGGNVAGPEIAAGLGRPFRIERVSMKPYPCCRSAHAVIDAVLDYRASAPAMAAQVESLHVTAPRGVFERCGAPFRMGDNPRLSAQFSIPFTAAIALRNGRITLEDFSEKRVREYASGMRSLIESIEVVAMQQSMEDVLAPVQVTFIGRGGAMADREVRVLKGGPSAPLNAHEQADKLQIAAGGILSKDEISQAEVAIRNLRDAGPGGLIAWLATVAGTRTCPSSA